MPFFFGCSGCVSVFYFISELIFYSVSGHATRLRNERDQLLKSGVYMESDRIIQEINQQIKEACLVDS